MPRRPQGVYGGQSGKVPATPQSCRGGHGCAFARPTEPYPLLLAGLRGLDLERAHLAVDDEVAVVELERARDAVLVHFERDRVDRRLFARLVVRLLGGLVEIADGHWPARKAGELVLAGRGVFRLGVGRDA